MLQPLKMQGEARNCEKRRFGALRARLCAQSAQEAKKTTSLPASCPDGPSVRISSAYDYFYCQFITNKRTNGGDPPFSSLYEPGSKREPPRFARRLIIILSTGLCFVNLRKKRIYSKYLKNSRLEFQALKSISGKLI